MKIIGTDIYIAYEDFSFLTLLIEGDYSSILMNFSFDGLYIEEDLIEGVVVFKITGQHTTQKPGEYFYEVVGLDEQENKTTLIKKSLFVIEETARYAAGITETESLLLEG